MAITQKQVKARIQQKHDTSANWAKATNFVPFKGEIIVYDDLGRIKVGDGTKTVTNLKFVDEHPHPYLPLEGGELDPDATITLASGTHQYTLVLGGSSITFMGEGGTVSQGSIQGISDTKGNASYLVPSLKCLNDNYLPLSGGTLTGALTATKFTGDASGLTNIPAGKLTGTISIDRLPDLSSKYLPKTGGTISGVYSESGKAGSVSLAPGFVEVFSEGTGTIKIYSKDSNDMVVDQSNLTPSGLTINGDSGSVVASFSKTGFYVNYGGGANHISVTSQNIAIGDMNHSSDLTITANGIDFPELTSHLTGVTADKGTSTTLVMSQKGVSDNYLALSGGTLTGQLTLSNTGIKFNTNAIKDVTYSTTDLVAGTSTLATNSIYIVYE